MIGKEILNYVIVSSIGGGGMGTVYLAEHKFIKQQKVAIKVIHSDKVNDASKKRLQEEAEKLAGLNHPNIVKFINYHIDEDGNVFLIMEYAEGVTLEQYINTQTGLIIESRILPIFEPILDAMEYAHGHNVIHRDIKPSNVIITTEGVPKILDFGISSIYGSSDPEKQEAFILGTPSYMSPEQVKGKGIDFRSDIYSLGVMLHQMLTGNTPYDTTTMSELDIQAKVISEPLPRMNTYYRYISDKMQAIVDKATAKDQADRYQTCAEFRKDLTKLLKPRKRSSAVTALLVAAAVILVGGGLYIWDYSRVKVKYYKDYVEQWGVPQGIGSVSASAKSRMTRLYRFEYRHNKLQRVSHINSLGNIINDGETERSERPIDMYLFYSDNNLISRVKTYDKSGKLVYVKAYNDKLTSAVFQYDDEFGTEKSLSGRTIGYVDSDSDTKGKISRWLITYDENGYVQTINYAGFQNIKVGDAYNIYGRSYVRDEKGRVKEEHYLGYDGQPKATQWGLAVKKFFFDDNDDWVRAEYYTVDMEPALDDPEGVYVYTLEYDGYGNIVKQLHLDSEGNLMLQKKNGIAGMESVIDQKGLVTEASFLDIDGNYGYSTEAGYARIVYEHDENGYVTKETCYDDEGNICTGGNGIAIFEILNDAHGNHLEVWYKGTDGEFTNSTDGIAGYTSEYDSVGNLTKRVFRGQDKNPTMISSGYAGYLTEYNSKGLETKITNLDNELQPTYDANGICVMVMEYDNRGNLVRRSFHNAEQTELVLSKEKIAGWVSTFDDNGNETERAFFDAAEAPCVCDEGYAKLINTYDENGNRIKYRYYDLEGHLVICDGNAGYDYAYDQRGNVLENKPVGTDEGLAPGYLVSRFAYDANDNKTEFSLYDRNGSPATNSLDYHKATYAYNSRNQLTETRYYNVSDHLVAYNGDTYAIQKNEYDSRGNRVKTAYFGTDEQPVKCDEGWSSSAYEYDGAGHIKRQLYFDVNGEPTRPEVMVPEGVCSYDKWGNMIYIASMDGNGNLIMNNAKGWSVMRREYDIRGNILNESYFNEQDAPMPGTDGYHKVIKTYTPNDDEDTVAFYGVSGEPVNCKSGYHKEVNEYDSDYRLVRYWYLNKDGQPANSTGGYHKVEIEWDGDTAVSRKYYTTYGTNVYSESWNGSEWIPDRSIALRKALSQYSDACPMDMGDDYGGIVISEIKSSGASCYIYFKVPHSKYELSYAEQSKYQGYANSIMKAIKQLISSDVSGISFTGIVKDSKNREITKTYL